MSKLFVIGNGFDLAHGLPTSYGCFHNYLREKYPDADEETPCVPYSSIDHHGEELWDPTEVAGYLMNLLSRTAKENWSDFEETLGRLDYDDDFWELPEQIDRDGERNYFREAYQNEDLASQLAGCVPQILDLFSEWVETIDISKTRPKASFQRLINPSQNLFLNFNYTQTLEKLYHVPNVCHIHGTLGEDLLVGHGAGARFDENHQSRYIGSEYGIELVQEALRKDTAGALEKHQAFFQQLSSGLPAVYSYGFSYGKVDEIYFEEICRIADTSSTIWYLLNYPADERERDREHTRIKDTLRRCGFKGTFSTFHCP